MPDAVSDAQLDDTFLLGHNPRKRLHQRLHKTANGVDVLFENRLLPPVYARFCRRQTAVSLTMGQLFHPIPHIAAHLPAYWSRYALEWVTLLKLLSLSGSHMALFLVSILTVYNLRMLDLFRYGASLETWTGLICLCSAIGTYYLYHSFLCRFRDRKCGSDGSKLCLGGRLFRYNDGNAEQLLLSPSFGCAWGIRRLFSGAPCGRHCRCYP